MKKQVLYPAVIVIVAVALAFVISGNWFQVILIRGDSMEPCLHNLQLVVIDKQSGKYSKGDVVAFRCDSLDEILVKRVAATEGDVLRVSDGILLRNGEPEDTYQNILFDRAGILSEEVYIEQDHYFVLGDNIKASVDSRDDRIGMIDKAQILGKVMGNKAFLSGEGN